jgi:phosphoribosyl 1,2-cyclic phosphodiesterase
MRVATNLKFLGTRGEIAARSRRHRRHSVLAVERGGGRVLVDCGADWRGRLARLRPDAIVLTHAHPDHVGGLADGAPCPVYASTATLHAIRGYPLADPRLIPPRRPTTICGLTFEAFPVEHSLRAPAVGYRVSAGGTTFFYAPDLLAIDEPAEALAGVALYVGDGASLMRPIVRSRGARRIGHASVRQQLEWCRRAGVRRVVVTHCGSQIVTGDARSVGRWVRDAGAALSIDATVAWDGMAIELPDRRARGRRRRQA